MVKTFYVKTGMKPLFEDRNQSIVMERKRESNHTQKDWKWCIRIQE